MTASSIGKKQLPLAMAVAMTALLPATLELAVPARAETPAAAPSRSFAQPALRPSAFPPDAAPVTVPVSPPQSAPALVPASGKSPTAEPPPAKATPKLEASWPKTLQDAKAEASPEKPEVYAPEEIAAAKAQCKALLKGLDVVVIDEEPIKQGNCGAPAPVQLVSVGKSPQVALSPPVTVTCDVVAAMHKWVTSDLQPLARKHLGAPLIGIETMSSYSCRNAYGRKRSNLSEHGRANAIDIRSFNTADARETTVLADWGPTGWEIRAQVAAAAKAAKAAAEAQAAAKAAKSPAIASGQSGQPTASRPATPQPPQDAEQPAPAGGLIAKVPGIADRLPGAAVQSEGENGLGWMRPSRLGGPKVKNEPVTANRGSIETAGHGRRAQFLRAAHETACKIFGTTLGPETNLAHKNHFHVDMAERSRGNFCE